jgi:hypothetical protein
MSRASKAAARTAAVLATGAVITAGAATVTTQAGPPKPSAVFGPSSCPPGQHFAPSPFAGVLECDR